MGFSIRLQPKPQIPSCIYNSTAFKFKLQTTKNGGFLQNPNLDLVVRAISRLELFVKDWLSPLSLSLAFGLYGPIPWQPCFYLGVKEFWVSFSKWKLFGMHMKCQLYPSMKRKKPTICSLSHFVNGISREVFLVQQLLGWRIEPLIAREKVHVNIIGPNSLWQYFKKLHMCKN